MDKLLEMNYIPDIIIAFSRSGATFANMLAVNMKVQQVICVGRRRRQMPNDQVMEFSQYDVGHLVILRKEEFTNKKVLIADLLTVGGHALIAGRKYLEQQGIQCNLKVAVMYIPPAIKDRVTDIVYAYITPRTWEKLDALPWIIRKPYPHPRYQGR